MQELFAFGCYDFKGTKIQEDTHDLLTKMINNLSKMISDLNVFLS